MTNQEINDFYEDYSLEIEKRDAEINKANTEMIKALLDTHGFTFVVNFLKDYKECECHDIISICDKPRGQKQSDYWGASKEVFVDQHCEIEDSYYGHIYFPLKDGKYLKCPFAC